MCPVILSGCHCSISMQVSVHGGEVCVHPSIHDYILIGYCACLWILSQGSLSTQPQCTLFSQCTPRSCTHRSALLCRWPHVRTSLWVLSSSLTSLCCICQLKAILEGQGKGSEPFPQSILHVLVLCQHRKPGLQPGHTSVTLQ